MQPPPYPVMYVVTIYVYFVFPLVYLGDTALNRDGGEPFLGSELLNCSELPRVADGGPRGPQVVSRRRRLRRDIFSKTQKMRKRCPEEHPVQLLARRSGRATRGICRGRPVSTLCIGYFE